jgi:hypothetical protein
MCASNFKKQTKFMEESMLIVETIYWTEEEKEKEMPSTIHTLFTGRSIHINYFIARWRNWMTFFPFYIKKIVSRKWDGKKIGTGAVHWREKDIEKNKDMCTQDYFFRIRADDDRAVSVPVGSCCCLELLDADWDGCIWWISLGFRR